ncbi:MAG: site-specific integrase [Campylobacterales bacterium]|nr:site-specific integrase [Campylobacterales bacterium]
MRNKKREFAIRERPQGWWQIDLRAVGGKRIASGLEANQTNKKLLVNDIIPAMIAELKAIQAGEEPPSSLKNKPQKVAEFGAQSLARHKHDRQEHVQRQYELVFQKHILPYFGKKKLSDIKGLELVDWQNTVNQLAGFGTLKKARVLMFQMFDDALLDEDIGIKRNPLTSIKLPKRIEPEREVIPFSKKEMAVVVNGADGYFKNTIGVLLFTGMRPGELAALEWGDVSFESKEVSITKTLKRATKGNTRVVGLPKTDSSRRVIVLLPLAIEFLKKQFLITGLKGRHVFLNRSNEMFASTDYWNTEFKSLLRRTGVLNRNMYQCRHTFASQMLSNGEDLIWVSQYLGHKSPNITLQKYARFIPGEQKVRAKFLESWHSFWYMKENEVAKAL